MEGTRSATRRKRVMSAEKKRSILTAIARIFGGLISLCVILVIVGLVLVPDYTRKKTPAGCPINSTVYLPLDEKTNVWVSAWLPPTLKADEKIPVLMTTSRYGTQIESGWLAKVLEAYSLSPNPNFRRARRYLEKGHAFVWVQSPGSCQSSGPRLGEYPPNEVEAMGLAIDWIVRQPWSNQRVGAFGGSYSGTTADMACATLRPELKAVYPRAPDFDDYRQTVKPGGLGSSEFVRIWGAMVKAMDLDDFAAIQSIDLGRKLTFWETLYLRSMIKGLQRPKGKDRAIFKQALEDHKLTPDVEDVVRFMEFKDSEMSTDFGFAFEDVSVYEYRDAIEKAQVNTSTRAGWMDAGVAEGALEKFLTFNTPQKVVLLPAGHPQNEFVNPFGENTPEYPGGRELSQDDFFEYFDRHLKGGAEKIERRRIVYFTYVANTWRETEVWPPEGIVNETWYLTPGSGLSPDPPLDSSGSETYTVDFTATTGNENRWMSQMGNPVYYGDRRDEDKKLLTYTSAPLTEDLEVTGSPTVTLYVSSTHEDGAFYVYLEDVGPDGRVSYLTEGLLRAIHRKTADPGTAPYVPLGFYHTFRKADALPLIPGEMAEIAITLLPVSTVFKMGHSIRIAFAGHDDSLKDKYPKEGVPVLTLERNSTYPSQVILPVLRQK
jgi:putative CocE/NonD family hydrolase